MNLLIWVIAAAAVFGFGFWAGDEWRAGIVAQRDLQQVQETARVQILRADRADQAAERHEQAKARVEVRYQVIEKEVDRVVTQVVYRDRMCFDADGLRVIDDALAAARAAAAGVPARPVSAAAGAP